MCYLVGAPAGARSRGLSWIRIGLAPDRVSAGSPPALSGPDRVNTRANVSASPSRSLYPFRNVSGESSVALSATERGRARRSRHF